MSRLFGLIFFAFGLTQMIQNSVMMMANTLTGIIPTIMTALSSVMREQIGFIPAVNVNPSELANSGALKAAKGQTIRFPIAFKADLEDITPGADPANTGTGSFTYDDLSISDSKAYPVMWEGEEELGLSQFGQYNRLLADQFEEGFRTFSNYIESAIAAKYIAASRAYGTAGTTPFGTAGDFTDFAGVNKILDDNGVPKSDRHLVLGSAGIANIRGKQSVLFKANEAGTDELLRKGIIGQVQGLSVHDSAGVKSHTAGTGAGYLVNKAGGYAVGDKTIACDTGANTILAGDVVTFAGDTEKYVVATALAAGSFTIAAPGLRKALADDAAITVTAAHVCNMAFQRKAIVLITRVPAAPKEGDSATDRTIVTDPVSGLAFEVAIYKQYRRVKYEIALAWGIKVVKPEAAMVLLG